MEMIGRREHLHQEAVPQTHREPVRSPFVDQRGQIAVNIELDVNIELVMRHFSVGCDPISLPLFID